MCASESSACDMLHSTKQCSASATQTARGHKGTQSERTSHGTIVVASAALTAASSTLHGPKRGAVKRQRCHEATLGTASLAQRVQRLTQHLGDDAAQHGSNFDTQTHTAAVRGAQRGTYPRNADASSATLSAADRRATLCHNATAAYVIQSCAAMDCCGTDAVGNAGADGDRDGADGEGGGDSDDDGDGVTADDCMRGSDTAEASDSTGSSSDTETVSTPRAASRRPQGCTASGGMPTAAAPERPRAADAEPVVPTAGFASPTPPIARGGGALASTLASASCKHGNGIGGSVASSAHTDGGVAADGASATGAVASRGVDAAAAAVECASAAARHPNTSSTSVVTSAGSALHTSPHCTRTRASQVRRHSWNTSSRMRTPRSGVLSSRH